MKWFLIKSSLFLVLALAFIFSYGAFCDYFFIQKRYLDLSEKKQWVLAQEGGYYNYAVLGSSRAFGAFDMNLLDSLTGMNGINLGSNGSGFKDNFLVLKLFLRTNAINKLFLQVDMGSLNSKSSFSNEFHAFTFLPYWTEPSVQEVLKEEIPVLNNRITSILPQWRYFYFNKYFSPKEVFRKANLSRHQQNSFAISKGGNSGSAALMDSQLELVDLPNSIDSTDWKYFLKIKELADAKGIALVFFTAPRYGDSQKDLKPFLAQLPTPTIFPDGFDVSDVSLFQDQGHLTFEGRNLFTSQFSEAAF